MDLMDIAIAKGMVNNNSGNSGSNSSSSGGGGGAHIVNCAVTKFEDPDTGSTEYLTATEKTAGEIFELACTGPVIINGTVSVLDFDTQIILNIEASTPVLVCAKVQTDENNPINNSINLTFWSVFENGLISGTYQMDEIIPIGYPPTDFVPEDEPSVVI